MKIEYNQKLPDPKYCNGCIFANIDFLELRTNIVGTGHFYKCSVAQGNVTEINRLFQRPKKCIDKFGE